MGKISRNNNQNETEKLHRLGICAFSVALQGMLGLTLTRIQSLSKCHFIGCTQLQ